MARLLVVALVVLLVRTSVVGAQPRPAPAPAPVSSPAPPAVPPAELPEDDGVDRPEDFRPPDPTRVSSMTRAGLTFDQRVVLRGGRSLRCSVVETSPGVRIVVVLPSGASRTIPWSEVVRVEQRPARPPRPPRPASVSGAATQARTAVPSRTGTPARAPATRTPAAAVGTPTGRRAPTSTHPNAPARRPPPAAP